MRTLKELIPLLIKKIEKGENFGLCDANSELARHRKITDDEFDLLRELIEKAKPHWWQLRYYCYQGVFHCRLNTIYSPFYWQRGKYLQELNGLINNLKKSNNNDKLLNNGKMPEKGIQGNCI